MGIKEIGVQGRGATGRMSGFELTGDFVAGYVDGGDVPTVRFEYDPSLGKVVAGKSEVFTLGGGEWSNATMRRTRDGEEPQLFPTFRPVPQWLADDLSEAFLSVPARQE